MTTPKMGARQKPKTGKARPATLKEVQPRNPSQGEYLATVDNNIITFAVGPAGTGKTYLAVYMALCNLWQKKSTGINKVILTRPVVEAGEKLGFLPGDLEDKMDPYMRPLYDALYDIAGVDKTKEKVAKKIIEIAPIAYMRGRTLHDAFVILDEAQNCTYDQLKMFLTRAGENVKLVISGDTSQSDLNGRSGLAKMIERVAGTKNVGVHRFDASDVVRSEIVRNLLISLEKYEEEK